MSTQESGDGVIVGFHKVGIRALDPDRLPRRKRPLDPTATEGNELLAAKVKPRRALALSKRKGRAKDDAPTVSFGTRSIGS